VANDDVLPTIQAYLSGQFPAEIALAMLKTRKLTDQYCLASEKALSMLRFTRAYSPKE
jgi:hypothetical protein